MKLQPRIKTLTEKRLVGQQLIMSLANNRTRELWTGFMPHRLKIDSVTPGLLYSLQVYPSDYFESFDSAKPFEKWAALEVSQDAGVPDGMHELIVPEGDYVVFHYRGLPANAASFFTFIFTEWLSASAYKLDARPHFEVLGEKYSHDSADSEEEIWIPVCSK